MQIKKAKNVVILGLTPEDLSNPHATSEVVENLLKVDGERKFVADLEDVPLLASLQIGTLVTLHLLCYENLAVMKLANVSDRAKTVLKLIGLDKLMESHHGARIAAESFDEQQ